LNFEIRESLSPTDNPFKDVSASKYFEREWKLPIFGGISENIDNMGEADHIQNPVPMFQANGNMAVMRRRRIPASQFRPT
jgi:hypothetical protein